MKYSISKTLTTGLFEAEDSHDKYLNRKNSYWSSKDEKLTRTENFMCSQFSKFKLIFKEYLL